MANILSYVGSFLVAAGFVAAVAATGVDIVERVADPCAVIGGQKWVSPKDVRACYTSFKVDPIIKDNIIQVINKTLAFHTSVNYQLKAPFPFTADVHEDVLGDLARIQKQDYPSEYDFHIDVSRTLKRLNDGHCVWLNFCYYFEGLFANYLPIPLALLTESNGFTQNVHIAPEAFTVASTEFADEINFWQDALPGQLKGQLASLSGAKVLAINGRDPFDAVNANAQIAGSFQAFGTRQNGFFSSYQRSTSGWNYIMGQFAQQSLPLSDSVNLLIQRVNQTDPEVVTLPYRSRLSSNAFNDTASWRQNNCLAVNDTNGSDAYASPTAGISKAASPTLSRKYPRNVVIDSTLHSDIVLPPSLQPSLPAVNGSQSVDQFYMLDDQKTGIMALGSFADDGDYNDFLLGMLKGLQSLKALGATQLIIDVSNNGGGYVCASHWLHRILAGPKATTEPQAGLDTASRAGALAQLIVKEIVENSLDPDGKLLYNPSFLADANNIFFPANYDWLEPPVPKTINGRSDAFSQRLGNDCGNGNYPTAPPEVALFDTKKVVIVSNGRCASSCSVFTLLMSKKEGTKTVVIGGKKEIPQQYSGIVGGQSVDFSTIDTDIKTAHLKNNTLAPPDLLVNGYQGITWRLAYGVDNPNEPEEWQSHPATLNLPITSDMANNPVAIWNSVVKRLLS